MAPNVAEQASTGRRIAFIPLDADGYATGGGWSWQGAEGESADTHLWLSKNAGLGLAGVDLVMPDGWVQHPDTGHGVRAEEVVEHDGFYLRRTPTYYLTR